MPVHLLFGMTREAARQVLEEPVGAVAVLEEDVSATAVEEEDVTATLFSEDGVTETQNLTMYRGNNKVFRFPVLDQDGNVVDITGAKIWFTVKKASDLDDANDADAIFQRKNQAAGGSDAEIEITDAVNGIFKVKIVPANTSDVEADEYQFDAQVLIAGGVGIKTVTRGKFTIFQDVTRTES